MMIVDHDLCVDDLCEGEWQVFLHHRACKLVLIGQLLLVLLDHQVVHRILYRLPQLLHMGHDKCFVWVYDEHSCLTNTFTLLRDVGT